MRRLLLASVALSACQGSPGSTDTSDVTFQADIRPIIETSCLDCHKAGGVGPTDFTYDAADWADGAPAWAAAAASAVQAGIMPPWMPSDDCHPIEDAGGLTAEQVALFASWADNAYAAGDEADYTAPAPVVNIMEERKPTFGEPDFVLASDVPYTPSTAAGPDDYRCIVTDAEFAVDTWVRGLELAPDQIPYVHHLIAYVYFPADVPAMQALDEADPGPGFTCFGNPSADTLLAWAPGQKGEFLPDGMARNIQAGSKIVFQIHYNTLGKDPTTIPADQTGMRMWLTPDNAPPENVLTTIPFSNGDIEIPAGDPNVSQKNEFKGEWLIGDLPLEFPVIGVMGHMHQLGTAIRLDAKEQGSEKACVLDIPKWDFNWQQTYFFPADQPVMLTGKTTFSMECVYDNSAANQQVVNGQQLEPRDVYWGDSTLDEMCLTYLLTSVPLSIYQQL